MGRRHWCSLSSKSWPPLSSTSRNKDRKSGMILKGTDKKCISTQRQSPCCWWRGRDSSSRRHCSQLQRITPPWRQHTSQNKTSSTCGRKTHGDKWSFIFFFCLFVFPFLCFFISFIWFLFFFYLITVSISLANWFGSTAEYRSDENKYINNKGMLCLMKLHGAAGPILLFSVSSASLSLLSPTRTITNCSVCHLVSHHLCSLTTVQWSPRESSADASTQPTQARVSL